MGSPRKGDYETREKARKPGSKHGQSLIIMELQRPIATLEASSRRDPFHRSTVTFQGYRPDRSPGPGIHFQLFRVFSRLS